MAFDSLGYPIKVGDTVAYAPTGRVSAWDSVRTERVLTVENGNIFIKGTRKPRDGESVINISYLRKLEDVKLEEPELFI